MRPLESESRKNRYLMSVLPTSSYPELQWSTFMNPATQDQIAEWTQNAGVVQSENIDAYKQAVEAKEAAEPTLKALRKWTGEQIILNGDAGRNLDWKDYLRTRYPESEQYKQFVQAANQYNSASKTIERLATGPLNTIEREQKAFRDRAIVRGLITGIRPPHSGLFQPTVNNIGLDDLSFAGGRPAVAGGYTGQFSSVDPLELSRQLAAKEAGAIPTDSLVFSNDEFKADQYAPRLTDQQMSIAKDQYHKALANIMGEEYYGARAGAQDPVGTYAKAVELYKAEGKEIPNLYRLGGSQIANALFSNPRENWIEKAYPDYKADYALAGYTPSGRSPSPTNIEAKLYSPETALLTQLGVYQPGVELQPYITEQGQTKNRPVWSLYQMDRFNPNLARQMGLAVREGRYIPAGDTGSFYGGMLPYQTEGGQPVMSVRKKGETMIAGRYKPYSFVEELPKPERSNANYPIVLSEDEVYGQVLQGDSSLGSAGIRFGEDILRRDYSQPQGSNQRAILSTTRTQLSEEPYQQNLSRVWGDSGEIDVVNRQLIDKSAYVGGVSDFGQQQNQALQRAFNVEGRGLLSNYGSTTKDGFRAYPLIEGNRWLDPSSTEALTLARYGQPYQQQVRLFTPSQFTVQKGGTVVQRNVEPTLMDVDTGDFTGHRWGLQWFTRQQPDGTLVKEQRMGWIPTRRINPFTGKASATFAGLHRPVEYSDKNNAISRLVKASVQTGSNEWKDKVVAGLLPQTNPLWERPVTESLRIPPENLSTPDTLLLNRALREQPYTLAVPTAQRAEFEAKRPDLSFFSVPNETDPIPSDLAWKLNRLATQEFQVPTFAYAGNDNPFAQAVNDRGWEHLNAGQRRLEYDYVDWLDQEIGRQLYDRQQNALAEVNRVMPTQIAHVTNQMTSKSPTFRLMDWEQQRPKILEHIQTHGGNIIDQRSSPLLNAQVAYKYLNPEIHTTPESFTNDYHWEDLLADQLEGKRLTEQTPDFEVDWNTGDLVAVAPGTGISRDKLTNIAIPKEHGFSPSRSSRRLIDRYRRIPSISTLTLKSKFI